MMSLDAVRARFARNEGLPFAGILPRHDPAKRKLLLPAAGWGAAMRARGA